MNPKYASLAAPLFLAAQLGASPAQASEAIIKKARCIACHAVDKKMVGPAYRDVAAKYRGDSNAAAMLGQKVRQGGVGTWGEIPMPAHPADRISDADLKTAIEWVLGRE